MMIAPSEFTIELIQRRQSYRHGARCIENGAEHWLKSGSADSAIPGLARKLIREHDINCDALVMILRDGRPVFTGQARLRTWAARRYVETTSGGITIRNDGWREFPDREARSSVAGEAKNELRQPAGYIGPSGGSVTLKTPLTGLSATKEKGPAATAIAPSPVNHIPEGEI